METVDQLVENLKIGAAAWNAFVAAKRAVDYLWYANLTGANLTGANLSDANLTRADLTRANLTGANLSDANLTRANLTRADLTDANLTRANLTRADLTDANLSDANLTRANLTRADLTDAYLTGANLTRADLTGADLTDADLTDAYLTGADLTGADLTGADLTDAYLTGANLTRAKADFMSKMMIQPFEVEALRQSIIDGKINGSTYEGDCCCFVGTLEKAVKPKMVTCAIRRAPSSPIERLFLAIKAGDTPETNQVSAIVLSWVDEFQSLVKRIQEAK